MLDTVDGCLDLHAVSLDGGLTAAFGDGEYRFRLAYGQLQALEEACGGIGAPVIAEALATKTFRVGYVRETIRLGLIGGGLSQSDALVKVRRFVESFEGGTDYWQNSLLAWSIIHASLRPPADGGALKKAAGTRKRAARVPEAAGSTSPVSTPPA